MRSNSSECRRAHWGAGLDRDEVVDRREAAFLLGRLVQVVEGRRASWARSSLEATSSPAR